MAKPVTADDLDLFVREHLGQYFAIGYEDDPHGTKFTGASGFFVTAAVRNDKRIFFVTTAHKLGAGVSAHRARFIKMYLHWPHSNNFSPLLLPLERWDIGHATLQPEWLYDRHSDVAVLPIPEDVARQLDPREVAQVPPFDLRVPFYMPGQRMLVAGQQVFLQGFPGQFGGHELPWEVRHPIWSHAMIVYPPNDDFAGLPTVLVHGHGLAPLSGALAFTATGDGQSAYKIQPVGVYSGETHYGHAGLTGPNISNVWKWSCLTRLISNFAGHDVKDTDVKIVGMLPLF